MRARSTEAGRTKDFSIRNELSARYCDYLTPRKHQLLFKLSSPSLNKGRVVAETVTPHSCAVPVFCVAVLLRLWLRLRLPFPVTIAAWLQLCHFLFHDQINEITLRVIAVSSIFDGVIEDSLCGG